MRRLRAIPVLLVPLLAGCVERARPTDAPAAPGVVERAAPTVAPAVHVTNSNWSTVVVYALLQGQAVRLGQVETGQSETFALPASARALGELELMADPVGADDEYVTGRLPVQAGTVVELRIENRLRLSSYTYTAGGT